MWQVLINGVCYATADTQAEGLDFAAKYELWNYGTVEVILVDDDE